jgi:hypothetical protein
MVLKHTRKVIAQSWRKMDITVMVVVVITKSVAAV